MRRYYVCRLKGRSKDWAVIDRLDELIIESRMFDLRREAEPVCRQLNAGAAPVTKFQIWKALRERPPPPKIKAKVPEVDT